MDGICISFRHFENLCISLIWGDFWMGRVVANSNVYEWVGEWIHMTGDFQNRLKNRDDPFAVEVFFSGLHGGWEKILPQKKHEWHILVGIFPIKWEPLYLFWMGTPRSVRILKGIVKYIKVWSCTLRFEVVQGQHISRYYPSWDINQTL